ncbi:MAG: acyltransferase family protein [Tatlockia sp.]|jgi:peptidoglycan/LPS O-acetylase OafA/YrhL
MKYRPDVDGLRAVAILFVLFFHAGLALFPSGFIGVDIFFVISGFLITGIIHDALQTNRFSFVNFYSRRLWRMQPVFIALLVVTALLTLFFYLPDDLMLYGQSIRKTSIFTSNQFFQRVTTGYFSKDTSQLPLLHTWSLSIEWQCYLILPLALFLLYKLFGQKPMNYIVLALMAVFFGLSLYFSVIYPAKTYYQFMSRIFEFLIGSVVALNPNRWVSNKMVLNALGGLALLSLLYIGRASHINAGFPNGYALIVCLATGTLIAIGTQEDKPLLSRLFALKPLVFIGLISYSLYIWHWPVFITVRYLGFEETALVTSMAFMLTFVLAYFSWRFIEKPTRKLHAMPFAYTLACLFIVPAVAMHTGAHFIKKQEGYPGRFEETSRVYAILKQYASPKRVLCLAQKNTEIDSSCMLGASVSTPRGFMIGDSFSNQQWQFMDALAKEAHIAVLAHATPACLTLPGLGQYEWYNRHEVYNECRHHTALYYSMIKANHYDFVILGQNWEGYLGDKIINEDSDARSYELTQQRITEALDKALGLITASGAKPVIIKSIALSKGNPNKCFFEHIKRRGVYHPERCEFTVRPEEEIWANSLFDQMKQKYPSLILIDPKTVQCPKGVCKADIDGIPVFRDAVHLSDYAAFQFGALYLKNYPNPLHVAENGVLPGILPVNNLGSEVS